MWRIAVALMLSPAAVAKTTWRDLAANPNYSFNDYVAEYHKHYGTAAEYIKREAIFNKNLRVIRQHNSDDQQTWKMGLNTFTDWEQDEVRKYRTGARPVPQSEYVNMHSTSKRVEDLPKEVDWRKQGIVTAVKNQGSCGSCWAFSATETIESHAAQASGKLQVLAPQQLVSCAPNPNHCGGTGGCGGSTMKLAFNYTKSVGLSLETSYPYQEQTGTCNRSKIHPVVHFSGYVGVPTNDYGALMDAVATRGPVSIMVAAGFMSYEEGVYSGKCGWDVDHGVQLVGYGSDKGVDYWLVRNSWGASWGEEGYIRIRRFGAGHEPCGLDHTPQAGVACKGTKGPIRYCGLCAMFCSASYPVGFRV